MTRNDQVFKDILLPRNLIVALYNNHKGWKMIKNKYVASGHGDKVDKAYYKVKLTDGNRNRNVKFELQPNESFAIAHQD